MIMTLKHICFASYSRILLTLTSVEINFNSALQCLNLTAVGQPESLTRIAFNFSLSGNFREDQKINDVNYIFTKT